MTIPSFCYLGSKNYEPLTVTLSPNNPTKSFDDDESGLGCPSRKSPSSGFSAYSLVFLVVPPRSLAYSRVRKGDLLTAAYRQGEILTVTSNIPHGEYSATSDVYRNFLDQLYRLLWTITEGAKQNQAQILIFSLHLEENMAVDDCIAARKTWSRPSLTMLYKPSVSLVFIMIHHNIQSVLHSLASTFICLSNNPSFQYPYLFSPLSYCEITSN
jgi:hypothetical protein